MIRRNLFHVFRAVSTIKLNALITENVHISLLNFVLCFKFWTGQKRSLFLTMLLLSQERGETLPGKFYKKSICHKGDVFNIIWQVYNFEEVSMSRRSATFTKHTVSRLYPSCKDRLIYYKVHSWVRMCSVLTHRLMVRVSTGGSPSEWLCSGV